jgi:putative thioredoxin
MQKKAELIFDVTTAGFQSQVLDLSARVPVVVDFWAAWCGPCRALGPVLEKAIADKGGEVVLAKVDTDREQELAQRYRITGIPAVKAFRHGQQVDEFTGARDARFVQKFLDRLVPSKQAQALDQAVRHLQKGQAAAAEAILRPLLLEVEAASDQGDAVRVLLAEAVLLQGPARYPEVPAILDAVNPRGAATEQVEALRDRLSFYLVAGEAGGETGARERLSRDQHDLEARYALASALAQRGAFPEALEELLALVAKNRRYRDDGARKAMLLLFAQLGPDHDLVQEYRRRLQVVL